MTQTLSYEEDAERAINPVKLANVEASRDCNGSQIGEIIVQCSLRDERPIRKLQTSQPVCQCVYECLLHQLEIKFMDGITV